MTAAISFLRWFDPEKAFNRWWYAAVLASVLWLSPPWYDKVRFWFYPVVVMQGDITARTNDGIIVHMYGEKRRGAECRFLGIQAFGDRLVGYPVDLYIRRVDMPSDGITKPAGVYDIGFWNIHPTANVTSVRVYVSHDCDGAKWATQIAKVEL